MTLNNGKLPHKPKVQVSSRKLKSISPPSFSSDLTLRLESIELVNETNGVNDVTEHYTGAVRDNLDAHAP